MILAFALFIRVLVSPSLSLLAVAIVYSSFWIPQIVRSIRRGTSAGLSAEYLLGTTILRAYFPLCEYRCSLCICETDVGMCTDLFACPENVLGIESSSEDLLSITEYR